MQELNEIVLNCLPSNWQVIAKNSYKSKGVFVPNEFELNLAIDAEGILFTINTYKNQQDFLADYMAEIKRLKLADNTKDLNKTGVKPIYNKVLEINNKKVFICVLEVLGAVDTFSVQVFYEYQDKTIGFFTAINKQEDFDMKKLFTQNKQINFVIKIINQL